MKETVVSEVRIDEVMFMFVEEIKKLKKKFDELIKLINWSELPCFDFQRMKQNQLYFICQCADTNTHASMHARTHGCLQIRHEWMAMIEFDESNEISSVVVGTCVVVAVAKIGNISSDHHVCAYGFVHIASVRCEYIGLVFDEIINTYLYWMCAVYTHCRHTYILTNISTLRHKCHKLHICRRCVEFMAFGYWLKNMNCFMRCMYISYRTRMW